MKHKAQGGAAAVEFALVFPIFLVLLFAIIEFGAIMYDKAFITNASREAARAGVVLKKPKLTMDEVAAIARKYCGQSKDANTNDWTAPKNLIGFNSSNVFGVSAVSPSTAFGTDLTVTVTYQYQWLVFGPLLQILSNPDSPAPLLGAPVLTGTTVMKHE